MKQVEIEKIVETWARASQIGLLINKKSPYKFLASFREYCDSNPKAFQQRLGTFEELICIFK